MRDTERVPLDEIAEIKAIKRELKELRSTTLKRIHDLGSPKWIEYTPILTASVTNPTLGSGSKSEGRYIRAAGIVTYRFLIQFGTSGVNRGEGEYQVSLPIDATSLIPSNRNVAMGPGVLFDWSETGHKEIVTWLWSGFSNHILGVTDDTTIFHDSPFLWTTQDRMSGTVTYQPITL